MEKACFGASGVRFVLDGHLISQLRLTASPQGEAKGCKLLLAAEGGTSSVACGDRFPLRTKTALWTVYSETLDLQGFAPPGEPARGSQRM